MNRYIIKFLMTVWLGLIISKSNGQCSEWNWPEDKKTTEEKVALLQDAMNAKKYRQALKPFKWLVTNTPTLNYGIYVHGVNIYEALADREKDATKKKIYIDSLLTIYDLRMNVCGDVENVLWRKAQSAFKYLINGSEANRVLPIMDSVFNHYHKTASDGLLLPYMQTTVISTQKYKMLDENAILSRYDNLVSITEDRIKSASNNPKQKAKLIKTRKDIDEWLLKVIKPDCDFVRKSLAPRYHQNPNDLVMAKRIFTYMLQGKCIEDPLWLETAETIFAKEKDYGLGKNISLRYLTKEDINKAEIYFDETIALAPTAKDSADIFYYRGTMETKKGDKVKAREYFQKCIASDNTRKDAFERIGDLYFASFDECAKKNQQADDRAIYLAAYNWYVKAGNAKKMLMAKQLFPSREEIFVVNYHKGDQIRVGCWINEVVTLQTRD